jgi:hypothetical protein
MQQVLSREPTATQSVSGSWESKLAPPIVPRFFGMLQSLATLASNSLNTQSSSLSSAAQCAQALHVAPRIFTSSALVNAQRWQSGVVCAVSRCIYVSSMIRVRSRTTASRRQHTNREPSSGVVQPTVPTLACAVMMQLLWTNKAFFSSVELQSPKLKACLAAVRVVLKA